MNHVPVTLFQIRGSVQCQLKHALAYLASYIHVGSPLFALYCWVACAHLPSPSAYFLFAVGHEGLLSLLLCWA